jgi:SAM-dependent methyltransferase
VLAEGSGGTFDTAVYVNVLEHIEDDSGELDVARRLLAPGGHLCLFVPAMPSLYSRIDHKSGHYRRYTKAALRRKVEEAGFVIERIDYFDAASIVPYWLMYRVLGVEDLGNGSNAFYDRVIVPISRLVQRILVHPPIGKNLILVARRAS